MFGDIKNPVTVNISHLNVTKDNKKNLTAASCMVHLEINE